MDIFQRSRCEGKSTLNRIAACGFRCPLCGRRARFKPVEDYSKQKEIYYLYSRQEEGWFRKGWLGIGSGWTSLDRATGYCSYDDIKKFIQEKYLRKYIKGNNDVHNCFVEIVKFDRSNVKEPTKKYNDDEVDFRFVRISR